MAKSLLLLDDDEDLLASLSQLVRLLTGSEVVSVRSLDELMARREPAMGCRLALLDIHLGPGRPSGLDAFAWLRQQGFGGRIFFFTGHARTHPLVERAHALGAAGVLEKPVRSADLVELLGRP
jgi:FixJ family two-component response regulator